jgi:predicted phosphoribosyltransferase
LHLPLGVCPVRKVGAPDNPELALGAVDDDQVLVFDRRLMRHLGIEEEALRRAAEQTRSDLRGWLAGIGSQAVPLTAGRTVILTDDGVATGYTAQAGLQSLRRRGVTRMVLAVPVGPKETVHWLATQADDFLCMATPDPFFAVGNFFEEWPQVTDDQVRALLLAGNTL